MAGRVYLEIAYVAPRALLWLALFVWALIDGIRHRAVRSRGFQLYWALVGSSALFVLQEVVLVILVTESRGEQQGVDRPTLGAYIFFANLAASYWFGILLTVAAGYCISRTSLGPHKPVVVAIPVVYLLTALVVDYVLYWIRGFDAFTDQTTYYDQVPEDAAEKVGGTTGFVYLICLLANTMAMLLAWFFIFDTIQKEKDILEQGYPDVSAVGPGAPGAAPGPAPFGSRELPVSVGGAAGTGEGTVGGQAVLLQDDGGNMSHLYVDVVEADLDAPKTFQDKVYDREKLRLVRRFFYGVCAYLTATIAVIFLPLFVPSVIDRTILILQNLVLWGFLGMLLWTFRMRQGSPYLLMDEDAPETGGLVDAPTTELGMMGHHDSDDGACDEEAGRRRQQGAHNSSGNSARFTLDDEDEHSPRQLPGRAPPGSSGGKGAARRHQPRVNVGGDAAQQAGVVVESLPTPVTPGPMTLPGR